MSGCQRVVLLACFSIAWLPGCKSKEAMLSDDLKWLGVYYADYYDSNKKPPADWEELIQFVKTSQHPQSDAIERVRSAGYQVTWGARPSHFSDTNDTKVLAKPPGDGLTLMTDGSVR